MSFEDDLQAANELIKNYEKNQTAQNLAAVTTALRNLNLSPENMNRLSNTSQVSGPLTAAKINWQEAIAPGIGQNPAVEARIATAISFMSKDPPDALVKVLSDILRHNPMISNLEKPDETQRSTPLINKPTPTNRS